jgi:hypothetical protein
MMTKGPAEDPESGRLTSEGVHLLKNHLGIILGFIDLVLDETPESDPRRHDLIEIKQAAVSAAALLDPSARRA